MKALTVLLYAHPKRRIPRRDHIDRNRRIPGEAYPQKSGEILSQRPTIHRPQHTQRAKLFGVRLSISSQPPPQKHGGFARLEQETFAAAGACSGRSAPGYRSRKYERIRDATRAGSPFLGRAGLAVKTPTATREEMTVREINGELTTGHKCAAPLSRFAPLMKEEAFVTSGAT